MELSDSAFQGRKLKREEMLFLMLCARIFETVVEEQTEKKDGKYIFTQDQVIAIIFAFGRKFIPLYGASLNKEIAEWALSHEVFIIADMLSVGLDMDELLKDCETEDEII